MLVGAVIGWGILSPVAKNKGWAAGPVGNWDTGARGWIVWVGMGLILGDSLTGLAWAIIKPLQPWAWRRLRIQRLRKTQRQEPRERAPLLREDSHARPTQPMSDAVVSDE